MYYYLEEEVLRLYEMGGARAIEKALYLLQDKIQEQNRKIAELERAIAELRELTKQ